MNKRGILALTLCITLFFALAGCKAQQESPAEATEVVVDTGILSVESSPSGADVYVDGEMKGATPLTLYNIPVKSYNVVIKKEGYADFERYVAIKVGRTEQVDAALIPLASEEKMAEPEAKVGEKSGEAAAPDITNKLNLKSFATYFDFDNKEFTELRAEKSDIFGRNYNTYIDFVVLTPAKMVILAKPMSEASKDDCVSAQNAVGQLYAKQTLCVITMEGSIFALEFGAEPNVVEWKQFN